jgi:hypothetical protein
MYTDMGDIIAFNLITHSSFVIVVQHFSTSVGSTDACSGLGIGADAATHGMKVSEHDLNSL